MYNILCFFVSFFLSKFSHFQKIKTLRIFKLNQYKKMDVVFHSATERFGKNSDRGRERAPALAEGM